MTEEVNTETTTPSAKEEETPAKEEVATETKTTDETKKEDNVDKGDVKVEEDTKISDESSKPAAVEGSEQPAAELSEEDLKAKDAIVERLSFFFSDANIRQDSFLKKLLMDKSSPGGGSVPFEVLMRFNTIKKHSEKMEVLVAAAKELTDVLIVDSSNMSISRVIPFTAQNLKENIPKSLYLENLPLIPLDGDGPKKMKYNVTVDDIRQVFEKYGKVMIVKLKFGSSPDRDSHYKNRNDHHQNRNGGRYEKFPIGEALVEFETVEGLQKAADATLTIKDGQTVEPKELISFGSVKTTTDDEAAATDKADTAVQVKLLSEWISNLQKNRDNKNKHKKRSRDEDDGPPLPTYEFDWKPGCVIKLTGLPDDCDREALLDAVAKSLGVDVDEVKSRKIYADYSRGQTDGVIRFMSPADEVATLAKKLKDGEIKISGEHSVADALLLEGDEEKAYWENFIKFKTNQIQERELKKRAEKRQKRGGGYGRKHR